MDKRTLLEDLERIVSLWGFEATQHTLNFIRDFPVKFDARFVDNNGISYTLTSDQFEKLRREYNGGMNKISAIKMFREVTGCSLKEAKDAIESYRW